MDDVDGGRRLRLIVAAAVLVAVAVGVIGGPILTRMWSEHPCVPIAAGILDYGPVGPAGWEASERNPPLSIREDCVTGRTSYSIKPGNESSLGLTLSYERFESTSDASNRLEEQRPSDATDLGFSDRAGDEGYLAAATVEGYSSVVQVIRDRNVLVVVTYRVDQPLDRATQHTEDVGDRMLEELNDYLSN